ncbi:MAG: RraA family protein [Candidatus Aminicenantales bacterium]|jgi:regulator of RNase E activity RraA
MTSARIRQIMTLSVVLVLLMGLPGTGQVAKEKEAAVSLQAGRNLIATPVYTEAEDGKILALFKGLRVSDVVDGMDAVGLQNIGTMDPEIHPLWRDVQTLAHRFVGVAVTARYVPTQNPAAGKMTTAAYDDWAGDWYDKRSSEPYAALIRKGTALVIEDAASADVGSIGSYNILDWKIRGCVGVVTSATARDSDEITMERVPLYLKKPGRGIRPGRNEIESVNRPIVCGGVLVVPGDIIVADGDGVVVVPRAQAEAVAIYARKTLEEDQGGRRELYKKLGLKEDVSLKK